MKVNTDISYFLLLVKFLLNNFIEHRSWYRRIMQKLNSVTLTSSGKTITLMFKLFFTIKDGIQPLKDFLKYILNQPHFIRA